MRTESALCVHSEHKTIFFHVGRHGSGRGVFSVCTLFLCYTFRNMSVCLRTDKVCKVLEEKKEG